MRGFTLIETLVSFLLLVLVASALAIVITTQNQAALRIRDEAELMETARIVRVVLDAEIRHGLGGRDWHPPEGDTVALRAFRGAGTICGIGPGPAQLVVRYRGIRLANPAKDSALVLLESGRWETRAVNRVDAVDDGCPGGALGSGPGRAELWTLDEPVERGVFIRLFERGSYHLADGAFRYRSGTAGRQPLTPQRIDDPGSFLRGSASNVEVELRLERGGTAGARASAPSPGSRPERWRIWPAQPGG
ncbi:MAG: hypothetical protein WDZ89_01025 [Gemmatimonadota bacterium]